MTTFSCLLSSFAAGLVSVIFFSGVQAMASITFIHIGPVSVRERALLCACICCKCRRRAAGNIRNFGSAAWIYTQKTFFSLIVFDCSPASHSHSLSHANTHTHTHSRYFSFHLITLFGMHLSPSEWHSIIEANHYHKFLYLVILANFFRASLLSSERCVLLLLCTWWLCGSSCRSCGRWCRNCHTLQQP